MKESFFEKYTRKTQEFNDFINIKGGNHIYVQTVSKKDHKEEILVDDPILVKKIMSYLHSNRNSTTPTFDREYQNISTNETTKLSYLTAVFKKDHELNYISDIISKKIEYSLIFISFPFCITEK